MRLPLPSPQPPLGVAGLTLPVGKLTGCGLWPKTQVGRLLSWLVPKRPYCHQGGGGPNVPSGGWGTGRPLVCVAEMNSSHNRGRIWGRRSGNEGAWGRLSVSGPANIGRRYCPQRQCTCVCKACLLPAHAHPALCFSYGNIN